MRLCVRGRYNPADPDWANRDRFVLSNGHACALQYAMLHLTGYDLSMDDLKQFRQLDSLTPVRSRASLPAFRTCAARGGMWVGGNITTGRDMQTVSPSLHTAVPSVGPPGELCHRRY